MFSLQLCCWAGLRMLVGLSFEGVHSELVGMQVFD